MLTSPPALTDYLGKKIDQICPFSLGKDSSANHCAHFVSHMMEYDGFEITCKNKTIADKLLPGKGAAIRVNDLFNTAPKTGPWAAKSPDLTSCLIFATNSGNMKPNGQMSSGEKKHIGIFLDGVVWHFGKTHYGVVKDQEKLFITKFKHAYILAGQTVKFFYGTFLK